MGIDKVRIDEMGVNLRTTAACLEYGYFHSVPQHKFHSLYAEAIVLCTTGCTMFSCLIKQQMISCERHTIVHSSSDSRIFQC